MPIFEGEDAYGWIYKVERYFAVNGLMEEEKLTAAGLCLEGKALSVERSDEAYQELERIQKLYNRTFPNQQGRRFL
ncbi:hypothetical protein MA16_Dca014844 [Dendrobium catenatum]|uniref:Uncharacterized protein n=1 Tax=Dendrobium catenatum TaxID=906689 RepID=A0A2I0V6R2_9ASPA|nr:hypothetical protein MA16_Dca014844 [Dendrobium catenatum]